MYLLIKSFLLLLYKNYLINYLTIFILSLHSYLSIFFLSQLSVLHRHIQSYTVINNYDVTFSVTN